MMRKYLVFVLIILLITSCDVFKKEDQLKIINIANEHLKKKAPEAFAESEYFPLLVDEGKVWRVEYRLPKGMIGGGPVVIIDKENLRIINVFMEQ
ncbi:NTF2 fold immunity protein [Leptospira santarosai]|uniref:NTF2 fold immunity protein n=1 Tax=Leptospira santarosai TaxID=28183 RepID=UPI000519C641|nr:NTF2 fold immunity protein [Leptospira santarosai]MDI7166528.1 NTF2 fold immunity protein [Leptospira santarosai]MDO6383351.1 NTF2 fold immunity protein [Leptospira santarosai]